METLFVIDNKLNSTFYYYSSEHDKNLLVHVLPETITETKIHLGEQFSLLNRSDFIAWFSTEFDLPVKTYVVITKEELLKIVMEELAQNELVTISNPSEFVQENIRFKCGKQKVTFKELDVFLTYDPNVSEGSSIFVRQEHIVRLYKQKVQKIKNPVILVKKFNQLKSAVDTNLTFTGMTVEIKDLIKRNSQKLIKYDLPPDNLAKAKEKVLQFMSK